jgi:hypothetical protein
MLTKVINLTTGFTAEYTLPPKEAVNAAYEYYERHNGNTWTYDKNIDRVKLSKSGKTWIRGDWTALA